MKPGKGKQKQRVNLWHLGFGDLLAKRGSPGIKVVSEWSLPVRVRRTDFLAHSSRGRPAARPRGAQPVCALAAPERHHHHGAQEPGPGVPPLRAHPPGRLRPALSRAPPPRARRPPCAGTSVRSSLCARRSIGGSSAKNKNGRIPMIRSIRASRVRWIPSSPGARWSRLSNERLSYGSC
jgi:hypothetical protein